MADRAPPLPSSVVALAPDLKAQGGGELTFFGLSVYDGWYWSPARGWPHSAPYALDLHYHRSLDGAKIAAAQRRRDREARLRNARRAHALGRADGERSSPTCARGDRLTGVYTGAGAVRYFHNGKPIGEIAEPGFAKAFFGIWLDPKTSRTDFREKLLGQR